MIVEKRSLTLNVQIEKQDLSCFEILSRLRLRLFWSREGLINKITEARKDSRGDIEWVEFAKAHHSHLVASCFAVMPAQLTRASRVTVKRAMFVFILELLNGGASSFFDLQDGRRNEDRAHREKSRLRRKRARAARRERDREAAKPLGGDVGKTVSFGAAKFVIPDVTCRECRAIFRSRKTLSKHTCPRSPAVSHNYQSLR